MTASPDWYNFQEEICKHFVSIGAEAKTNQTIQGVRTRHDIDILVRTKFLGEDLTWIIEAKHWKSNVPKEKVLALRTIVDDIGADRGFIVSQIGFQSGAYEAAENTNITLKTFDELKQISSDLIQEEILKAYKIRASLLTKKYWSHSKSIRKKYKLRGDPYGDEFKLIFSGTILLNIINGAISCAGKGIYPLNVDTHHEKKAGNDLIENFQQLRNWLDLNLNLLDAEILNAEYLMMKNGEFNPDVERLGCEYDEEQLKLLEAMSIASESYVKVRE
jgi:hypothetical protein